MYYVGPQRIVRPKLIGVVAFRELLMVRIFRTRQYLLRNRSIGFFTLRISDFGVLEED